MKFTTVWPEHAGFLPFFEPVVDWEINDADLHRRTQPYPFPGPHHTHTGRNLHTLVPIPSSTAHPTFASHGGIPSHVIVNPEPIFVQCRSAHPTVATLRIMSGRDPIVESSNPANLPPHSTTISGPADPGSGNPPPNPEPRPRKKQRIHVTVSEPHSAAITAPLRACHLVVVIPLMLQQRMSLTLNIDASNPRTRPVPIEVSNSTASASRRTRPSPSPE